MSHFDPAAWDTNPEDIGDITIDMEHVTRTALAAGMRAWYFEYTCHGKPFHWRGQAANESAADTLARHDLSVKHHTFNSAEAILAVCLEE